MLSSLRPILVFLGFVGFTYVVLRHLLAYVTNHQIAPFVVPGMALLGVLSAWLLLSWKLQDFLIPHLLFVGFLFVYWYRANNMQTDRLTAAARAAAQRAKADEAEVLEAYFLTRWYMRLSMASYGAALLLAFAWLYGQFHGAPGSPPATTP
jgi:hypothetical protein